MNRRKFLTFMGTAGVASALGTAKVAEASHTFPYYDNGYGVLHDMTRCIGCRKCAKFAPDKFTVNGFLAAVNYQAEAFPTAEDVSAVGCPTGALLTVEEHLKIEQNEPEWSAGKK